MVPGFLRARCRLDLASLRTRADRDGDEYIVNGQKIWTSYAESPTLASVRTDTTQSRGRGISVLLVPMNSPGLEVRKIAAVVGEHAFHELFFTDVRVAASARLGDENDGWAIVRSALASERVGLPRYIRAAQVLDAAARWAREQGQLDDRRVLARLGEAQVACEAARLLVYRVVDERAKGSPASLMPMWPAPPWSKRSGQWPMRWSTSWARPGWRSAHSPLPAAQLARRRDRQRHVSRFSST